MKLLLNKLRHIFPVKHDYDLERPLVDEITTVYEHSLSGIRTSEKLTVMGFKCKNCEKTLWLERWQMKNLPKKMKYGCSS